MKYIKRHKLLRNTATILVQNGKKFDTMKDLIDFALENFTPEQIDETVIDMPFCEDKQQFWYAARKAYIIKLEEIYRDAWKAVRPDEPYEEQMPTIDYEFNEEIGVFDFFIHCATQNAEALKIVEESGAGDILRKTGGL